MRRFLVAVLAATIFGAVASPSAVAADVRGCPSGEIVANVYQTVLNDAEVGVAGNQWARSSYTRNITIVRTSGRSFCAVSTVSGKFSANAGLSPAASGFVSAGVSGGFSGRWGSNVFTARFRPVVPTSGTLPTVDYACSPLGCPGFVDWRSLFFSEVSGFALSSWTYSFNGGLNGYFINRNDSSFRGTYGDITG